MVADEMFPDGPGALDFVDVEDGVRDGLSGPAGLMSDLTANEKTVHADFYNKFGDLFDDTHRWWLDWKRPGNNKDSR